jgi:hypothetical protein
MVMRTTGRLVGGLVLALAVLVAGGGYGNAEEAGGGAGQGGTGSATPTGPIVPPPTLPAGQPTRGKRHHVIPEGFLPEEERAKVPLSQPGVYWVRNDGADLPPLLSPCGGRLASDKTRVDGRQLVLVGPTLWKAGRLVVYRNAKAAKAAVNEIRRALRRCERHNLADGETTVWTSEALSIGDEALFVGGQQFRGANRVPGNFRGVLMRKGRAVQVYLDCGQATERPTPATDETGQVEVRTMAQKLAHARWAQSS